MPYSYVMGSYRDIYIIQTGTQGLTGHVYEKQISKALSYCIVSYRCCPSWENQTKGNPLSG